jgi:glutathione S-transferase
MLIHRRRVPAIQDPNTDITLWESGAIIEYLIDTYDKSKQLTYDTVPEKFQLKQWLHFQASGQGPYFGQAIWFEKYHPEKIASAQRRYRDQVLRVYDVLNRALEGRDYLVGDKCTYADISFVPWNSHIHILKGDLEISELEKKYPNYVRWHNTCIARKAVEEVLEEYARAKAAHQR